MAPDGTIGRGPVLVLRLISRGRENERIIWTFEFLGLPVLRSDNKACSVDSPGLVHSAYRHEAEHDFDDILARGSKRHRGTLRREMISRWRPMDGRPTAGRCIRRPQIRGAP